MILKIHGAVDRDDETRDSYVDHRGPLHRLPGPHEHREADPGLADARDENEPLPLPRLRDARLEPARDPQAHLGGAAPPRNLVGGAARRRRDRREVLEPRGCQDRDIGPARPGSTRCGETCRDRGCDRAGHDRGRRRAARRSSASSRTRSTTRTTSSGATTGARTSRTTCSPTASRSCTARAASARARFSRPESCTGCGRPPARTSSSTGCPSSPSPSTGAGPTTRGCGLEQAVIDAVQATAPELAADPPDGSLAEVLDGWSNRLGGPVLVVLDQFEEYFVYHRAEPRHGLRGRAHGGALAPRPRGQLPHLDPRGRARSARRLRARGARPARQPDPDRAPRRERGARGDRESRRALERGSRRERRRRRRT